MNLHVNTPADPLVSTLESVCDKLSNWAEYHDEQLTERPDSLSAMQHEVLRDRYQQLIVQIDRALHEYAMKGI